MKKRIDQALVDEGLAPSKTKAQELIAAGAVEIRELKKSWRSVTKSSTPYTLGADEVRVQSDADILKYVSRGGLKLEGALDELKFDVDSLTVLDVGASTGGFTDCLLQRGAAHVTAIDVSEGEMAAKLLADPRVEFIGQLNARELDKSPSMTKQFDLGVVDVSFISLKHVFAGLHRVLKPGGFMLALVKPQFEVGRTHLDKRGIVKSQVEVDRAIKHLILLATEAGFLLRNVIKSKIKGKDGNQEYFLFAEKDQR